MNWYKKSQSFNQMEFDLELDRSSEFNYDQVDIEEMICDQKGKILKEFIDRKDGDIQSWYPVSFARVKKIWQDYARTGVVRDVKGLEEIVLQTIENIARLYANTELCGHTGVDPDSDFEDFDFTEEDKKEFWGSWTGSNLSDMAIGPLYNDAIELARTRNPNEALLIVDRIFNRIHQRGDLSSFFIEGGSRSLGDLFEK